MPGICANKSLCNTRKAEIVIILFISIFTLHFLFRRQRDQIIKCKTFSYLRENLKHNLNENVCTLKNIMKMSYSEVRYIISVINVFCVFDKNKSCGSCFNKNLLTKTNAFKI